ncbi:MAG: arylsulfatase [Bacteroidota bacterium]|nr:arylsulfatase [Bacteroidota bacterium]MDP4250758.1 arylsulfatase [Bacteroidota bacterium]
MMNRISILSPALGCIFSVYILNASAQQKPNVIFILADDMGYGDLGCYGQKLIRTPNIDLLASGGIRFTRFYAGTSVCAPSRSSLLTGQHTGHTAIRGNYEIQPEGQLPLPDSTYTMAKMFKEARYITGCFGKWGLGFVGSSGDPVKQGFDQFFGYNCQRQAHNYFPDHLWDNDERVNLANTNASQKEYAPELIQKKILAFIENNKAKPFFLFLTYTLPHAGLQLPAGDKLLEAYKQQFEEKPRSVKLPWDGNGYQPQEYPHAAYAAMVTKLDHYVGEIKNELKTLGIENNTLIIFTSDNGPHREGGNDPEFFKSSGGLRGIKRDLYEGGIREPMIAYWPAVIKKKKDDEQMGAFWDFFPTFAEMAGQPIPSSSDGISLLPTLRSKGKQKQHDYLYWEFHEDGGSQAVRMGNWKAVRLGVMQDPDSPILLFNLSKDQQEQDNVAAENREVVLKAKLIMKKAHVENKNFPFIKE